MERPRANRLRIFLTVTLSGCRYGLIGAAFVVFTLAITDFGAPKVIGGDFNVLATDVYKQVIGQQNFIMIYLFVNAMTTVSAVMFIYGPDTNLASVAVLNMDDAGDITPAAAMGMMIFYTAASVRLVHFLVSRFLQRRTQA